MKRLILRSKDNLWPTVVWQGSQLVVYYLGEDEDDVEIRETRELDFEEFFLHLDRGGSVFVTMNPHSELPYLNCPLVSEPGDELLQDNF
ncbi:MAG: hypothetical protein ABSA11_02420 [Candidatus Bathyarchaeia archaeon]|jgi:hypothetical protein